jgi:plastocyanin
MRTRALLLAASTLAAVASVATGVEQAPPAAAPSRPAAPPPAPTHRLEGRLELTQGGRPSADRTLDRTRAAVWYEPAAGGKTLAPRNAVMTTVRKAFQPGVTVVPVGSSIRFPNQDPILHNVFSVSGRNSFDLGLVGSGQGKSATFPEAGIVRVFCNVHHSMFAHVVVVSTPFFTTPDAEGRFELEGLPAGAGTLRFWHERAEPGSQTLIVPRTGALTLQLPITQPKVPAHKNKLGRSYTRGAYE